MANESAADLLRPVKIMWDGLWGTRYWIISLPTPEVPYLVSSGQTGKDMGDILTAGYKNDLSREIRDLLVRIEVDV